MAAEQDRVEVADETSDGPSTEETFNPWSVVNLVFEHLCDQGLHPTLGHGGDPGVPASELLVCLGIQPRPEGDQNIRRDVYAHLAEIRSAMLGGR